ncbi:MAG: flavoprotein [Asgard group archaeon]|nr:flavoprotein [Asgard group archaeon]
MKKRIAWGITGAGCWLFESLFEIGKLLRKENIKLDLFFSKAGHEVALCYGVFKKPTPKLKMHVDLVREKPYFNEDIFQKDYIQTYQWLGYQDENNDETGQYPYKKYQKNWRKKQQEDLIFSELINDVIFELDEGASFPTAAKAGAGKYDAIIISPATGNTVAKITYGIADSLISNLALMGTKNPETEIIVIPTDYKEGKVESYLPVMLHPETCKNCQDCDVMWSCKEGAIQKRRGKMSINRLKCIGCLECVRNCRFGVLTYLENISITVAPREARTVEKLTKNENVTVFEKPDQIMDYLNSHLLRE